MPLAPGSVCLAILLGLLLALTSLGADTFLPAIGVPVRGMGVSPRGFALLFATVMIGQILGTWLSSRLARLLRFSVERLLRERLTRKD